MIGLLIVHCSYESLEIMAAFKLSFLCYSHITYQVESVCFSLCIISNRHSFERNVLESFQGADNRFPQEQE